MRLRHHLRYKSVLVKILQVEDATRRFEVGRCSGIDLLQQTLILQKYRPIKLVVVLRGIEIRRLVSALLRLEVLLPNLFRRERPSYIERFWCVRLVIR